MGKSPALSAVMAPLHKLEREAHRTYQQAVSEYEVACERVAIANSAAKSVAVAKLKKDPTAKVEAPLADPEPPIPQRYVVNNFSVEALGEVLINNPDGVLAFNDEVYGLLKMADKPGKRTLLLKHALIESLSKSQQPANAWGRTFGALLLRHNRRSTNGWSKTSGIAGTTPYQT